MTGALVTASPPLGLLGPCQAVEGAGFVLCALTDLLLVIPQADVVAIEHGTEFSAPEAGESTITWFDGVHGKWPVCALDCNLRPCPTLHASGSFLVFVKSVPMPVGLRCESVRIVRARSGLDVQPLPAVMHGNGVWDGVARIDRSQSAIVAAEGKLPMFLADIVARQPSHE